MSSSDLTSMVVNASVEGGDALVRLLESTTLHKIRALRADPDSAFWLLSNHSHTRLVFYNCVTGNFPQPEQILKIRKNGFSGSIALLTGKEAPSEVLLPLLRSGVDDYIDFFELNQEIFDEFLLKMLDLRGPERAVPENEEEEFFRILFENAPVGLMIMDRDGSISAVNTMMLSILEKLFSMPMVKFPEKIMDFPPLRETSFVQDIQRCLERVELIESECSVQDSAGFTHHLKYQFTPAVEFSGRVTGVQAVISDITRQKTAEEASRESRRRLTEMLTNIRLLAVMLDMDGNITFCNDFLLSLTGWEREEILGKNWYAHFIPESRGKSRDLNQLLNPETLHYRHEIVTREGGTRIIHWNNTLLKDQNGKINGIASIGEDVTERLKAEEEIKDLSLTIIQVQEEERSRISMEIHDEVGQSLFALKLKLQRFFAELKDQKNAEKTAREVIPLINLIANHIRQFSHNLSPVGLKNLGLPSAIEKLVETYQDSSKLNIRLRIDDLDRFFPGNWDINFYRIVQEALNNIVKHSGADEAEVLAHNPGNRLLVRIKDNGKGADFDHLGRRQGSRGGIGLSIMRQRANLMGAKFNIRSYSDGGTEITIEIPKRKLPNHNS